MECPYCSGSCIKKGKRKSVQRYLCKICCKSIQSSYCRHRIPQEKYLYAHLLHNECCSMSSIGRLLKISKSSVQRVLTRRSACLPEKKVQELNEIYEIDELRTYCGNKRNECWVIYALNRRTREVVAFHVGRRTKENIGKVVSKVLDLTPKRIFTDGLNIYKSLISKHLHTVYQRCTNHIERMNLNLRNCLKRLSRRTLCYSKNDRMLFVSLHLWLNEPFV